MKLELPLDFACNNSDEISPEWHRQILEERDTRLAEGKEKILDFEEAMRALRCELDLG